MDESISQSALPQADLLDRMLEIGQAIQQKITTNPQKVYELIVESVCELTGADCAVLYPYHPSYGEFYDVENVAACGLRHKLPIEKEADKKRRLSARVHQQGKILHEDVEREDPQIHQKSSFIAREGIKAFMGLSLRFGKDIVGILYVDYRKPHHFSDTEKQIIRLFGHQAAMAVSSLWGIRRAEIRAQTVTKLKTIGETLVAIKDPLSTLESLLQKIADNALEVLDADIVNLYRYDQTQAELIWPPLFAADELQSQILPQTKIDNKYVVKAIESGEPQYIDTQKSVSVRPERKHRAEIPAQQSFVVRERIASFAVIPLVITGEIVGVMFVNYRTPQLFGPEQKDIIETFAAQATVAIQNARLFQLERQKAEALQEIEETFEPETVVERILDELSNLIEFHSASIQLIQDDNRIQVGGRGFSLQDPLPAEYLSNVSKDPLINEIVQSQRPLVLSNVNEHQYWRRTPQTFQINSWIGAPLIFEGHVIGLLTLDHGQPGFYTQASGDVVESFARRVAPAIHNSQLFTAYDRRVEALTILNQVGQTLTAGLRLTEAEILTLISEQAAQLVDARQMYIALYDEETEIINFGLVIEDGQRVDTQDQAEYRPRKINRTASGKTDYVLLTRRAILHRTRAEEVAWYQQPGRRLYSGRYSASHLAVPMMAADKVIGVIAVYSWDQERAYDELDRQVLTAMASQAAIALDNARLHHRLERRIKALSALNEVGQELTAGLRLDEDQILELIYEQTHKLTGTQDMYIALYDEATEMIRFGLALDEGKRVTIKPRKADWKKRGKTEEVIFTEKPMLHKTKQESEDWYEQPGRAEFYGGRVSVSWLGVPMLVGKKVLGIIAAFDFERELAYDEQDLQVLESMANQAAIALDNARLYARRARELKALNEISQALTAGSRRQAEERLGQSEILELIYEQTRKLTGAQDMYIALYDEATEMIRFGLALDKGKRVTIEFRQANRKKWGKTEEVIFTQRPMLHKTKQESGDWYKEPGRAEFYGKVPSSWLGVPMLVGKKVLGVIAVWDFEREHVYDEQDLQVLESMANQAAIALDNATLYGSLDRRIGQIQTVQEITNAIRTYAELPELLQSILDVSLPRLNARAGTIQLLDRTTNDLVMEAAVGIIDQDQSKHISLDQGITGQAAREKKSIYIPDTSRDERFLDYLGPMRSKLAIPLLQEGDVIGVFNIEDPEPKAFDETTRQLAQLIADQAAIVIQNALAREELIANRQLAALGIATAAIQHRINNTLNIINPNIIRLKRRVDQEDATIWEILDIVERNTKYTAEYIQRIQEPLKDVTLQPVDINLSLRDACTQVMQQNQALPGFGEMQVKYNLDDSLPPIEASLGQITEIFRNLIENSYKAMGKRGGDLTLTSHRINDWLEVEIRDTGLGIPLEIQDKLFSKPVPSRQPGQTGQGSGLGLWLSALLLKRYGGEIRIRHTGPDGTTVMVRLPITPS